MSTRAPAAARHRWTPKILANACRSLGRKDPVLGALIRRIGPCGLGRRGDPYRYLVRAVLYQQITGKAARTIEGRLKGLFDGRIPVAPTLAKASAAKLRSVGLSRQKAEYLREIAAAFAERRIQSRTLARMSDDEVIAAVTDIRGVGVWTAHMLLMFPLERPDVLPVGDLGVVKGAQSLYGLRKRPDAARLEKLTETWRPYRSVGSWYMWRELDPNDED